MWAINNYKMGLLDKLFGKKAEPEHAVIAHFNYNKDDLQPLHDLEDRLEKEIEKRKIGIYDGHEVATDYSDGFIYMYGPNAEVLFKGVKDILESTDFMIGSTIKLRFGPPEDGVKEIEIKIPED